MLDNERCISNASNFSFVNFVLLSRMHKEDRQPGLSVWRVTKYDKQWVWRKQTLHQRDHVKPQQFIHQGWWTAASFFFFLHLFECTYRICPFIFILCQFAAVQFSSVYSKVFDFNDYTDGTWDNLLMKEVHMKGLTNTYKALGFVL